MDERHLLPDFAASADPAVSFDGKSVIRGKASSRQMLGRSGNRARGWGGPRRITACRKTVFVPFIFPMIASFMRVKIEGRFVMEAKELERRKPLLLTYLPGSALPTDILARRANSL